MNFHKFSDGSVKKWLPMVGLFIAQIALSNISI